MNILLIGAGGHARACMDVIESQGKYSVYGSIAFESEKDLPGLLSDCPCALVAVGQIKSHELRFKLFSKLIELGYQLPVIISPNAYVSPRSTIGIGTIVMHGAVIQAGARIGENCIINDQSLIEHDAVIGDHCHISTGAIVNGTVEIGDGSFLGSRSVVKQGIRIGKQCVVGMGAVVRHTQPDGVCFYE